MTGSHEAHRRAASGGGSSSKDTHAGHAEHVMGPRPAASSAHQAHTSGTMKTAPQSEVRHAAKKLELPSVTEFEALKGRGVRAQLGGKKVHLGGPRLLEMLGVPAEGSLAEFSGRPVTTSSLFLWPQASSPRGGSCSPRRWAQC